MQNIQLHFFFLNYLSVVPGHNGRIVSGGSESLFRRFVPVSTCPVQPLKHDIFTAFAYIRQLSPSNSTRSFNRQEGFEKIPYIFISLRHLTGTQELEKLFPLGIVNFLFNKRKKSEEQMYKSTIKSLLGALPSSHLSSLATA